jgi:hypothetical protein
MTNRMDGSTDLVPITFGKATIYRAGGFMGIVKTEVREGSILLQPYAQYKEAAVLRYKQPRARNLRGSTITPTGTSGIFLLVLEGWGHPDPDSMFGEAQTSESGLEFREGRYSMCDPRWESDFDTLIEPHLATATVLYDGRIPTAKEA